MCWSILLIRNSETEKKDIFQTPKVRQPDGNKKRNKNKIITSLLMHYPE
jgi:hypothetical protein